MSTLSFSTDSFLLSSSFFVGGELSNNFFVVVVGGGTVNYCDTNKMKQAKWARWRAIFLFMCITSLAEKAETNSPLFSTTKRSHNHNNFVDEIIFQPLSYKRK